MIWGKIIDEKGQPLEFANISLYSSADSTMITGTITNAKGEFSLQVENIGDAFLQILPIHFLGHRNGSKNIFTLVSPSNTYI